MQSFYRGEALHRWGWQDIAKVKHQRTFQNLDTVTSSICPIVFNNAAAQHHWTSHLLSCSLQHTMSLPSHRTSSHYSNKYSAHSMAPARPIKLRACAAFMCSRLIRKGSSLSLLQQQRCPCPIFFLLYMLRWVTFVLLEIVAVITMVSCFLHRCLDNQQLKAIKKENISHLVVFKWNVYTLTWSQSTPKNQLISCVREASRFSHHLFSWSSDKTIGCFLLIVTALPSIYHWEMCTVCAEDFIFLTTFSSGNISQHVLYCLTFSLNQLGLLRLVHVLQAPKTYNGKLKRFVDNWMRQIVELKKSVFDLMNSFERWENSGVFSCILRQDPSIWVFGHFWLFAPWHRRGREASSVKIL